MARRPSQSSWVRVVALLAIASLVLLAIAAAVSGIASTATPGVSAAPW